MPATRRKILGLSASLAASRALPAMSVAAASARKTAPIKLRSILIPGGTGVTGPHQVPCALSRGHKVEWFNRGRRPK